MLNHEQDELLSQEIADEELRELLQRLGEIEYAWTPKTTVADVVEATSSNPVTVGRLLAEIRKEDWEERFGQKLDRVESRVTRLENQAISSISRQAYVAVPPSSTPLIAVEPISTRQGLFIALKAFLVMGSIVCPIYGGLLWHQWYSIRQSHSYNRPYRPAITREFDGKTIYLDENGKMVTDDHGRVRGATATEQELYYGRFDTNRTR